MLTINPRNLKTARNNRRWTQDQLAEKAKVEKGTISRIERGELTQARVKTAQKLSQALSISIEELMGDVPLEAKPPAGKSTISVTIVNRARNALELVKRRYRVSTATVYELAPLLFFLAAEQMLVERQEKVEQLKQQLESVKAGGGTLISETRQQDLALILDELNHVHTSTVSRELFEDGARSSSGDVAFGLGPFDDFLKSWTKRFPNIGYDIWEGDSPFYRICCEEVWELAANDDDAFVSLMAGEVSISDIPKDLLGENKKADRKRWFAEQQSKAGERQC